MTPSIHILFEFKDGPYGGANQFLKALRNNLLKLNRYQEDINVANIVLANVNPGSLLLLLQQLPTLKKKYPEKIIITRLDGPISLIRGQDKYFDKITAQFIKLFADGIIFQSTWCKKNNAKLFNISSPHQTVIHNAADNNIFHTKNTSLNTPKTRLIASSWSPNLRKGFKTYEYLDKHLDFSKYEMTFVGNSPIKFKNIKIIRPLSSKQLASTLQQHHIYTTASKNDPCSNALIEAMSCGLPAVAINSGGHPELIKKGGELFQDKNNILKIISQVAGNLDFYKNNLPIHNITSTTNKYLKFATSIYQDRQNKTSLPYKNSNTITFQSSYLKLNLYLSSFINSLTK